MRWPLCCQFYPQSGSQYESWLLNNTIQHPYIIVQCKDYGGMVTESYSNKNTTIKMIMNYSESFQLYATYVAGKSKCIRYTLYIALMFQSNYLLCWEFSEESSELCPCSVYTIRSVAETKWPVHDVCSAYHCDRFLLMAFFFRRLS